MTFQIIIRASSSVPAGARYFRRAVGANKHVKRRFSKVPPQLLPSLDRVPLLPDDGQAGSLPASSLWPILLDISCLWWNCEAGERSRPPGCYPFFPIRLCLPGPGPPCASLSHPDLCCFLCSQACPLPPGPGKAVDTLSSLHLGGTVLSTEAYSG